MSKDSETNLPDFYQELRDRLRESDHENPDAAARDLIKRVMDVADIDIVLDSRKSVSALRRAEIAGLLERLLAGEPVSRIFGERDFWGIPFAISPAVLDPRPDTETIVEAAVRRFFGAPPETVLDLGAGSGCIIIALLTEWPDTAGVASDISAEALAVAKKNGAAAGFGARLKCVQADWGDSLKGQFDLIVSNPPYIATGDIPNLSPAVRNHDPILALDGGVDGFECYRRLFPAIKRLLKPEGAALLEVGFSQADEVARLAMDAGLRVDRIVPDLAGVPRVVEISFGDK